MAVSNRNYNEYSIRLRYVQYSYKCDELLFILKISLGHCCSDSLESKHQETKVHHIRCNFKVQLGEPAVEEAIELSLIL